MDSHIQVDMFVCIVVRSSFCFRHAGKMTNIGEYMNVWIKAHNTRTLAHSHVQPNTQSWAAFILGQRGPFASRVRYKTWQAFFSFANGFAFAILVINARRWSSRWRCCCCCCWRAMVLKYFFVLGLAPLFVLYSYYSTTFAPLRSGCVWSVSAYGTKANENKQTTNEPNGLRGQRALLCWYLFHFIIFQR